MDLPVASSAFPLSETLGPEVGTTVGTDVGTDVGTGGLFFDKERLVGSFAPFESIEEARVSDRPGLGRGTIFPGSRLLLLEAEEERELISEDRVKDRPTRRWLAILFR